MLPLPSYQASALFRATTFFLFGLGLSLTPTVQAQVPELHWSNDGKQFWYRAKSGSPSQLILVDIAKRKAIPLAEHRELRQKLAELLDADTQELKLQEIRFAGESGTLLLKCNDQYFTLKQAFEEFEIGPSEPFQSTQPDSAFFLPPRSGEGQGQTHIEISNELDAAIELVWIGRRNSRTSYGKVNAGQSHRQHTFVGHVWGILDSNGRLLACFEAQNNATVKISEKSLKNVRREQRSRANGRDRDTWLTTVRGSRSPDRKWTAEIREEDAWLVSSTDGEEEHLLDGQADKEWSYNNLGSGTRYYTNPSERGEFFWSPKSDFLVALQTKRSDKEQRRVHYVESTPRDQLQPKLHNYQYSKPGDDLPIKRIKLFSMANKLEIPVSSELFANPFSLRFLGWSESADRFFVHYNQRGHQVVRVLEVRVEDGMVRPIIEEKSESFIHYSDGGKSVFEQVSADQWIWASERSGWNHLYRYSREQAKVLNAVTSGNWNFKRMVRFDRQAKKIWFMAVGLHEGQDPYHEHFCSVNFDGSEFKVLTDGDGTHKISFTRDNKNFFDTYSRVDMAPTTELRDAESGEKICLLQTKETESEFGSRRLTSRFSAKGRDGKTDIWGIIHWPRDFDPEKKYAVIEQIYAGPHDHHVPKSFRTRFGAHNVADAGFIVVQIDGMGTAWRSKAFHDKCYKNLRDAGFPDRIAWLKAAAAEHPQMDLSRVGIYGGSAGGQNAMAALLWHNEFYKVAVADCGCHDNRMDKIWWNEQWMGWPVDQSYIENSNMENAHLLEGHLMLTLGEMDENVDPASTIQVVKKLIDADKDFEFVLLPGRGHGAGESRWAAQKRLRFFQTHLGVPQ
ncbi:MAG: prolyl oligopeptidase family serine peptidase [Planctomycetota bacterium]